jgi:TRAP-type mannitol/chloroaromatic compound transport system substrate-binding protein
VILQHAVRHDSRRDEAENAIALARLQYQGEVEIPPLPPAVLGDLRKHSAGVLGAESEESAMARKVYSLFTKSQTQLGGWRRVSEAPYQDFAAV